MGNTSRFDKMVKLGDANMCCLLIMREEEFHPVLSRGSTNTWSPVSRTNSQVVSCVEYILDLDHFPFSSPELALAQREPDLKKVKQSV